MKSKKPEIAHVQPVEALSLIPYKDRQGETGVIVTIRIGADLTPVSLTLKKDNANRVREDLNRLFEQSEYLNEPPKPKRRRR